MNPPSWYTRRLADSERPPAFASLADSDRVDHAARVIYASPLPSVPPVCTAQWDDAAWERWHAQCARVGRLIDEAGAAGYRTVLV
jgi:hypothetical protein